MRTTLLALLPVALATAPALSQDKTLTVYTYESFTAEWGPGPQVEKAYEATCGCDLRFVSVADGVALLSRVRLEGEGTRADIVLGLDTNLTAEARQTGLFVPSGVDASAVTVPGGWNDETFLPFDYGYFAIVYDSTQLGEPPASLKNLVDGDAAQKIVIQDPRTSTPGLGLLLWVRSVYGDEAPQAWAKLRQRILTVTPGWSEAYGLFTTGEASMVLSYTTSPAYHMLAEDEQKYRAAVFEEGNYMQVEVAGMTTTGADNPLAKDFLAFMLTPAFQDIIPQTNWMLPAAATSEPLDPAFTAFQPSKSLSFTPEEVAGNRKAWVDEWLSVMSE